MYERTQLRRSDDQDFHLLKGRQIQSDPHPSSDVWWHRSDLPAFVLYSLHKDRMPGVAHMH